MYQPTEQDVQLFAPLFYHTVNEEQTQRMVKVRLGYIALAHLIKEHCPSGRSFALAVTELEYSLMRAIQAIAMEGELQIPLSQAPTPSPLDCPDPGA